MTSVDKARRPAAAAKARPQPARASKAGAKERPHRVKAPAPAPAGKPASGSAKAAKTAKPAKVAKASGPIAPSVAKPAAKTSAQIPEKPAAKSAPQKPASAVRSATKSASEKPASAVSSAAKSPEKTPLETPARAAVGGPAERSGAPVDRLPPVEPTEKPRRGLGALGKRAFSGPAPVLPLLAGPRTPSRKTEPGPLIASELPAVAAGALPRDAVEFLRAELRAMLALAEDPPPL